MSKKLQVLVVFEFDDVESPDGFKADEVVSRVSQMMSLDEVYDESGASAIWVDDAMIVSGAESFADLFKPIKKGVDDNYMMECWEAEQERKGGVS